MTCAICNSSSFEKLLSLECCNLDDSRLYNKIKIYACGECGHLFNGITEEQMRGVLDYYESEYSLSNIQSPNATGDIPGSSNHNSVSRYTVLYEFIRAKINRNDAVLDIGCASGGFLRFLKSKGFSKLHGIEFSAPYVVQSKHGGVPLDIQQASAENIPFGKNTFDFLFADQVVEHLFNPNKIFEEAKRVIKKKGFFCVSVPDAMLYDEHYFFDFFWFLVKEHIQHFDYSHLSMLASLHGFKLVDSITTFTNMTSDKAVLPNLTMLFQYVGWDYTNRFLDGAEVVGLKNKMVKYILHCYEEMTLKQLMIKDMAKEQKEIYLYGVSRELFYLHSNTRLGKCRIAGIIDDTPYKQQCRTFNGMPIVPKEVLRIAPANTSVLITATAHTEKIRLAIRELGFMGEIIEI